MPAAPDYETLYDVETAFEPALKAVLTAASIPAYTQRDSGTLPAVRVDIQFALGAELKHRGLNSSGQHLTDAWSARLLLRIVTPRFTDDTDGNPVAFDPGIHRHLRARLRILVQHILDKFDAAILPYHVLTQILAAGSSPQLETEDGLDITELEFACVISIRNGSWPLTPAA